MGLLNEIFNLTKALHTESADAVGAVWNMVGKKWEPHKVKQNIIQHSIYGVDIEAGAVEIARLRFWLSLIIEEKEPKPLPHLEYKIVEGNSLISKLGDTIIDIEWDAAPEDNQTSVFGAHEKVIQRQELLSQITALQKQIFEPDCDHDRLSLELRNRKIELLQLQLAIMVDKDGMVDQPQVGSKNFKKQTENWLKTKGWQKQIKQLEAMKNSQKTPLEFFDWKLDFPEVMNPEINEDAGFDIVIGNPPYGAKLNHLEKQYLKYKYAYLHTRTMDSYNFFLGVSELLLNQSGNLIYIIPNAYFFQNEFLKSRCYFLEQHNPTLFINLGDDIFDAVVPSGIFAYKNSNEKENCIRISDLREQNLGSLFKSHAVLTQIELQSFGIGLIPFDLKRQLLFKTIKENNNLSLNEIVSEVNSGITTGLKEAFILEESIVTENNIEIEVCRPTIEGRNLHSYTYDYQNKFIIYTDRDCEIKKYPYAEIFLEGFKDKLSARSEVKQGIKEWYKLGRARSQELLASPKIMCRETGDKLIASFDDKNLHPMNTVICIKLATSNIGQYKFLTLLLNSKLLNFCMECLSQENGRVFAKIRPINIRQLPLPSNFLEISEKNNNRLNKFFDKLNNEKFDDNLVYKLYNLTYEEALIIEPELANRLTEEEYAAIEVE